MYSIIIKGLSGEAENLHLVHSIDYIECQDDFTDYLDDDLLGIGLIEGYMSFELVDDKLYTITEYTSTHELTKKQLDLLADYTQGQWSDGIGEGFEQQPCYEEDDKEVYISPWYYGQEVTINQVKQ